MKDVADALARLNELGRPDLAEPIHFLMGERDGLMKALASAKTVIEAKDKAYSLIQQRWDAMAAKAATVDSERECNEKLTAEVDTLSARVAELERDRDQLALSLSATKAERDHAVRSAELWESEHRAGYEAMVVYKHLWLEGRAIMAVCGYFSRMRGPDVWLDHGSWDEYPELFACAGVDLRSFQHGTRFYAGSAPVPAAPVVPDIGIEWKPCVKLPVVVHVREQRVGETHVSTREGITPVKPDDLIMRGVKGEEYPIGRELFAETYRMSNEQATTVPAALADALEHAGTRAEFHPDSEIAVLCRKAAAALRARAVPDERVVWQFRDRGGEQWQDAQDEFHAETLRRRSFLLRGVVVITKVSGDYPPAAMLAAKAKGGGG